MTTPPANFAAALAKKWADAYTDSGPELLLVGALAAAIREALEEAEKISLASRDLEGPHEGKQLNCGCDLMIVTHLKAWNAACNNIAAAIAALREGR